MGNWEEKLLGALIPVQQEWFPNHPPAKKGVGTLDDLYHLASRSLGQDKGRIVEARGLAALNPPADKIPAGTLLETPQEELTNKLEQSPFPPEDGPSSLEDLPTPLQLASQLVKMLYRAMGPYQEIDANLAKLRDHQKTDQQQAEDCEAHIQELQKQIEELQSKKLAAEDRIRARAQDISILKERIENPSAELRSYRDTYHLYHAQLKVMQALENSTP